MTPLDRMPCILVIEGQHSVMVPAVIATWRLNFTVTLWLGDMGNCSEASNVLVVKWGLLSGLMGVHIQLTCV